MLQSGDRDGARYVYSLALDSASLVRRVDTPAAAAETQDADHDIASNSANDDSSSSHDPGACFVASFRLAQLSFGAQDLGAEAARGHLVSAWELREHPLLRDLILVPGGEHALLGRYFCAIGLALRRLYADAGLVQEEKRVLQGLAGLGLADRATGSAKGHDVGGAKACPVVDDQPPSPPSAAGSSTTCASSSINHRGGGGDGEGCMILLCEDCGVGEPVEEEDRTGGAFYCEECTEQFETSVAEVRVNEQTNERLSC